MLDTVVVLKPRSAWRRVDTWYSSWAREWAKRVFRHFTPDTISTEELVSQMNRALKLPGVSNAWTMPIRGRIDMLSTGIRTPVGLKIAGADLQQIQEIGTQIEALLNNVKGTRSVLAERTAVGHFIDLEWNREQLARYNISVADAQKVVENAIGGDNVSTVVLGPERYRVNVRYQRDFRSDLNGRSYPDTVTPGPMFTQSSDGRTHFSQPLPAIINIPVGGKAALRLVNLSVAEYFTLGTLGVPMKVVGWNAKLLRDQAGNHTEGKRSSSGWRYLATSWVQWACFRVACIVRRRKYFGRAGRSSGMPELSKAW